MTKQKKDILLSFSSRLTILEKLQNLCLNTAAQLPLVQQQAMFNGQDSTCNDRASCFAWNGKVFKMHF